MHGSGRALIGLIAALAVFPGSASAQETKFGPPIPGMCVFGRSAAIEQSPRGREIAARSANAAQVLASAMTAQRDALNRDLAKIKPADTANRLRILEELNRITQFEAQSRARIDTQTKAAFAEVEQRMVAALARVITQKKCSAVIERSIVYGWNNQMDITEDVKQAMN